MWKSFGFHIISYEEETSRKRGICVIPQVPSSSDPGELEIRRVEVSFWVATLTVLFLLLSLGPPESTMNTVHKEHLWDGRGICLREKVQEFRSNSHVLCLTNLTCRPVPAVSFLAESNMTWVGVRSSSTCKPRFTKPNLFTDAVSATESKDIHDSYIVYLYIYVVIFYISTM